MVIRIAAGGDGGGIPLVTGIDYISFRHRGDYRVAGRRSEQWSDWWQLLGQRQVKANKKPVRMS